MWTNSYFLKMSSFLTSLFSILNLFGWKSKETILYRNDIINDISKMVK
jgi:hypothetical protein